jgi:DNA-binding NtrC family response regulator
MPSGANHGEPAETRLITGTHEVSFRRFQLRVIDGPDRNTLATARSGEFAVGTEAGNDLVLSDATVSRHHCLLRVTELGLLVRDLGSTNGTWVDNVRIEAAYLRTGSTVVVGKTGLRVELLDDEVRESLTGGDRLGHVLGASAAMRRIFAVIERIAGSDATVLLEGETGTGKTLIAETIHAHSPRASHPFVVVDCAAIPPTLIESELFGHEKGAFTGAHATRAGAFENAAGGTLFLDEIGELSLEMQPKLLRAVEAHEIKRVGATEPVQLDLRLIAATNRDLREEVNRGSFRSDLYYRLDTVRLRIPPLRERREDIPMLVARWYEQFAPDAGHPPPADLVQGLLRQPWPGNVRQLRSAVERAVLLGDVGTLAAMERSASPDAAQPPGTIGNFDPSLSYRATKDRAVSQFERWYVTELLRTHDGNLSQAARSARMDRNHLRDLVRKHGVPR